MQGERDPDPDIEREIRESRKFTPQEAMARMAGPGAMKGASPVSPAQQAEIEVGTWLRSNVPDPGGALSAVLHRNLRGSRLLLDNVDRPLLAVAEYCRHLQSSDQLIEEVVREADVEWGRAMDERPHFQREGALAHPDDPYTLESVRAALTEVATRLDAR
jgi:hypothetical protein